jgi:hypothetical protein
VETWRQKLKVSLSESGNSFNDYLKQSKWYKIAYETEINGSIEK